jgi:arylsulfatase A-like enzyme
MLKLLMHMPSAVCSVACCRPRAVADRPNIVYILADDLGYGDVSCFNPKSKINTPNIDRLAALGMRFTDAHSASAVCTPTRAGILTGRYPWRTRLKSGVLYGWSPHLIDPARLTVAAMLKQQGYHTACIGKWHLGMDWAGAKATDATRYNGEGVDYSAPIRNGPTAVGFNYFYGISASLDMPPFIWIENDHSVGLPTTRKKWVREGPAEKDFEAVDVLPTLTKKAISYLDERAKSKDEPFFLYVPLNSPHTPIVPSKAFLGKSGLNAYADFVLETDDAVGQIVATLDKAGFADNTLVIFTSDNGCSPSAGIPDLNKLGHDPSAGFRGHKADIFEGGHRIPFVARWPGKVKAGSSCADTICLNDLMATAAEITGVKLPDNAAEDSVSILPDLLGTATKPAREAIVHASINGSLAIRQGDWKLEVCPGSGGWSAPRTPEELKGLRRCSSTICLPIRRSSITFNPTSPTRSRRCWRC